jgi:hypothetical protein
MMDLISRILPRRSVTLGMVLAGLAVGVGNTPASGATAVFGFPNTPVADKWLYGNVDRFVGGQSDVASTFANADDDSGFDRLAGMLVTFQTTPLVQSGLAKESYAISAIRLSVTVLSNETFHYDPTYDSYRTVLDSANPEYLADSDIGKPVEVFGVGLRHGYTGLTVQGGGTSGGLYGETSPFGSTAQTPYNNVYPIGFDSNGTAYDVMGNITDRKEAYPFGTGTIAGLDPGELVPWDTEITFNIEITNPFVLNYVREGLSSGIIGFYISGLHGAEFMGGSNATYPRFYTWEGAYLQLAPEFAPRLEVEYTIIPEPQLAGLLIVGLALLSAGRTFRHRNRLA